LVEALALGLKQGFGALRPFELLRSAMLELADLRAQVIDTMLNLLDEPVSFGIGELTRSRTLMLGKHPQQPFTVCAKAWQGCLGVRTHTSDKRIVATF
jgi:hypothetical protein